jgi:hypothetical protein
LRGCEAVPIWLLRGRYDTQGPRYARKNSTTLGLDSDSDDDDDDENVHVVDVHVVVGDGRSAS